MARGLTPEQETDVLRVYPTLDNNTGATARALNLPYWQVHRFLKSGGHLIPTKRVSDGERRQMVDMYLGGASTWQIGAAMGYLNVCVRKHLRLAGVVLRNRSEAAKTYSVNQDYFRSIDTPNKAYLWGLICADGNMSKDTLTLALQESDKDLLTAVASEIGSTGPLTYRKPQRATWQGMWVLRIHDKAFCEHLRALGIVERKTSILTFPSGLDAALVPAFILGLMDGDGCVSYHASENTLRYALCFAGSQMMMEGVRDAVQGTLGIVGKVRHGAGRGWVMHYSHTNGLAVLNWLYANAPTFCMERKRDKYHEIVRLLKANPRVRPRTISLLSHAVLPLSHAA